MLLWRNGYATEAWRHTATRATPRLGLHSVSCRVNSDVIVAMTAAFGADVAHGYNLVTSHTTFRVLIASDWFFSLVAYSIKAPTMLSPIIISLQSYLLSYLLLLDSITHSLSHSRLKSFLFCKSSLPRPFLFLLQDSLYRFPILFTVTSEHIRLFTF